MLRYQVLSPQQILPGSTIWVPYGNRGWSAIEVTHTLRKRGHGYRVNPVNQNHRSHATFRLDQVIDRNPSLKGKDKPKVRPERVFNGSNPTLAPTRPPPVGKLRPSSESRDKNEEATIRHHLLRALRIVHDDAEDDRIV